MLTLFTDTDTDTTPEIAKKYGYHLISMPYIINDKEIYPYEDFEKFDGHAFYEMLRKGTIPKTTAISPEKYIQYFEPEFKKGNDILYVHFSSAMSGTFNSMNLAINSLKEKYPKSKFYEIDTKAITIGSLALVEEIGDRYLKGEKIEELLDYAKNEVDKFATYFYADELTFFKRSGRVSGISATMGNLLGIKPIIFIDSDGQMKSIGKTRGRYSALMKLVDYVVNIGDDVKKHRIIIGHTDALPIAQRLEIMLREKLGNDVDIEYVEVNPTAGSHCGPSGVGVCFHSLHR
jgi:DegV family protein with EDD domain